MTMYKRWKIELYGYRDLDVGISIIFERDVLYYYLD